jgi:hypothetical protein
MASRLTSKTKRKCLERLVHHLWVQVFWGFARSSREPSISQSSYSKDPKAVGRREHLTLLLERHVKVSLCTGEQLLASHDPAELICAVLVNQDVASCVEMMH